MEQFRHCPICTEVPSGWIYQCTAGHFICDSCVFKVEGGLCPQCRIPFTYPQIRCRVLEEILDIQNFECKFKDEGCRHVMERRYIRMHSNSCHFNPELFPLCEKLGDPGCNYRGSLSKNHVIDHIKDVHQTTFEFKTDLKTRIGGDFLMNLLNTQREAESPIITTYSRINLLVSEDYCGSKPLFLVSGIVNKPVGYLSFVCIKIWESKQFPSPANYRVEFVLNKNYSASSQQSSLQAHSSRNPPRDLAIKHFPMLWTLKVYTLQEAPYVINQSPVTISLDLLKDSQFGESGDSLNVEIYPSI